MKYTALGESLVTNIVSLHAIFVTSIPISGWIKETAWVYMVVKPQHTGCITIYTPIINGYVMQSKIY